MRSTQKILNDAASEAHAWIDLKYETIFTTPFNRRHVTGQLPALAGR